MDGMCRGRYRRGRDGQAAGRSGDGGAQRLLQPAPVGVGHVAGERHGVRLVQYGDRSGNGSGGLGQPRGDRRLDPVCEQGQPVVTQPPGDRHPDWKVAGH